MAEKTKKEKKITVKFFVHKNLLPIVEGKEKRYPLYMAVTYNRQNTMIKCLHGGYFKDLKQVEKEKYPGYLAFEERIITKTIRHFAAQDPENFTLKGVHHLYEKYGMSVHEAWSNHLKGYLMLAVLRSEPHEYYKCLNFEHPDVEFKTLWEICQKLYPKEELMRVVPKAFLKQVEEFEEFLDENERKVYNYSFPTLIDLLVENKKSQLFN